MNKRIISAFICIVMVMSLLPVLSYASGEVTTFINEEFDHMAVNETKINSLLIGGGVDARVVKRAGSDKAFFAKAWGDNVLISAELSGVGEQFVIEGDIRLDGAMTDGALFTISDSAGGGIDILTLSSEGKITLCDGKKIGGYRGGEWVSYAFAFDLRDKENLLYDIYINGEMVYDNWILTKTVSVPEEISFFVADPENGKSTSFYLDNLKVYSGNRVLGKSLTAGKGVSSEEKPFAETLEIAEKEEGKLYNFIDFDTKNAYSLVPKGNIMEKRMLDDDAHPTVFYVCRDKNSDDAFMDITNDTAMVNEWKFVVEFDLQLIRNAYRISIAYLDNEDVWTTGAFITGTSGAIGNIKGGSIPYGKWTKVSVMYDMTKSTYALYLDGVCVVPPQKLPNGRFSPVKLRIGTSSGGGAIEYYLDNVRIYSGNEIKTFEEDENEEVVFEGDNLPSIRETDAAALTLIGNAQIFKDDTNAVVFGNKKYKYEDVSAFKPYKDENGVFMVPCDLFEKAFGVKTVKEGDNIKVGAYKINMKTGEITGGNKSLKADSVPLEKDGTIFLPLRSAAEDCLGRSYYLDRGMHIFDKSKFKYENSVANAEIKEPIDTIYRFMQFERKSAKEIFSMVDKFQPDNAHPRILANKARIEEVKTLSRKDAIVASALQKTLAEANKHLSSDNVKYDIPDGVRLLVAARNVMERLVSLSAAYMITDDDKYAARAWQEMESCLSWKDWNTSHYLDNSELLYGVAVAFDSCYDYLTNEQRQFIMDRTYELSIKHSVAAYGGSYSGSEFRKATGNWGMVCNGGIITACLAFGREGNEKYQKYYEYLLENALQGIEFPLMLFFPDGGWSEGLAYWEYTVSYLCGGVLAPLYFSTGTTLDIMSPSGIKETIESVLYLQGGSGKAFNYGDNGSENMVSSEHAYVIPLVLQNDALMRTWAQQCMEIDPDFSARTLLWYNPPKDTEEKKELPLEGFFTSCEAGSMFEEWNNRDGSCAYIKVGRNNTNHSHLDLGTFCFDTLGERWAIELGKDSYNIEGGYWGNAGWQLYAKRPEGQNCVVINPREDIESEYYGGQYLNAYAPIVKRESSDKAAYFVADLSDAYKYDTSKYLRGYYLGDDRRTLTVQDEMNFLQENSKYYWFMHTRAAVEIDADGKGATLALGGKELRVEAAVSSGSFKFKLNKVERRFETDPVREAQLQGTEFSSVNVLTIEGVGSKEVILSVKLIPVDADFDSYEKVSVKPIDKWSVPKGKRAEKVRLSDIKVNGKTLDNFAPNKFEYEIEVPYGESVPKISATSDMGEVLVSQSSDAKQDTVITVTNKATGKKAVYKIKHLQVIKEVREIIAGLEGKVSIPSGYSIKYGSAEASDTPQDQNGPKNITDGDFATRWAAAGEGVWCEIDLGEVTDISGVAVGIYDGAKRQNNFKIMISEDGALYKTVFDGKSTGQSANDYESYMFSSKARYIRYVGFGSSAGTWNSVLELGAIVK